MQFETSFLWLQCCLNLLRVVAHTSWGADQQTLSHLYRSLIRSKLDYGCIVYGSECGSYLQMLDPIQNHALRLSLGAFRTSPSSSLCVLANEPPLYVRKKKLPIQYSLKLSSNLQNHPYITLFNYKFKVSLERKLHQIPPLVMSKQTCMLLVSCVLRRNVLKCSIPATPPWVFNWPHIDYSIHQSSKDNTAPEIYRNKFFEFCDHYNNIFCDYTQMAIGWGKITAAVVYRSTTKTTRLPNTACISVLNCKLFYLHWLSFVVAKKQFWYLFRLYVKSASIEWF